MPHGVEAPALAYRISYPEQAGVSDPVNNFPQTWEEFFFVAKTLKANGKPVGQALGQSLGDPSGFAYPFMWSYGSTEVEGNGAAVAFNKPAFADAMTLFIHAWKDGYDETGPSWDDTVNIRPFLSDQISATLNGSSIYLAAVKAAGGGDPGTGFDVVDPADIHHTLLPEGPAGRFNLLGSCSYAVMNYSENAVLLLRFIYALAFMGSGEMKTLPVGVVTDLIRADVYQWGSLMAAGVLASVPVAIIYSFFVDNYVSGLTAGATKG